MEELQAVVENLNVGARKKQNCKISQKKICDCKCFFKCKEFDVDQIKKHFYEFHEKDYNEQTSFLSSSMELSDPKRKRVKEGNSHRNVTVNYFLLARNGEMQRVCKKMICHTFQITQRRLQILVEKLKNGIDINDQRGKHENRPHRIVVVEKGCSAENKLRISSQKSNYNNNSLMNDCLTTDLNSIVKTDYNSGFGLPKRDYCNEHLGSAEKSNKTPDEKTEKGLAEFRDNSDAASNSLSPVVIRVDLQQVTFTPSPNQSENLHQRQNSTYNFTVQTLQHNKVDMYTWLETVANGGPKEIASCLYKHISLYYSMLKKGEIRKLVIWSERYVGQNDIWTINSLCHSLFKRYFSEINQQFLTSEQSISACDQDFALIGKTEKDPEVFIPEDVSRLIESSRETKLFKVHQMDIDDFKNFDVLQRSMNKDLKCEIIDDI